VQAQWRIRHRITGRPPPSPATRTARCIRTSAATTSSATPPTSKKTASSSACQSSVTPWNSSPSPHELVALPGAWGTVRPGNFFLRHRLDLVGPLYKRISSTAYGLPLRRSHYDRSTCRLGGSPKKGRPRSAVYRQMSSKPPVMTKDPAVHPDCRMAACVLSSSLDRYAPVS
jgi:hypothetical protein